MPPPLSHFLKIHLNIISHLLLVLPSGLFPSGFPTKTLYTPLLSLYLPHAHPSHSSQFDHPDNICTDYYAPHYVVFSTQLLPLPS